MNIYELLERYTVTIINENYPDYLKYCPEEQKESYASDYTWYILYNVGKELGINLREAFEQIPVTASSSAPAFARACWVVEYYVKVDKALDEFLLNNLTTYDELKNDEHLMAEWEIYRNENVIVSPATAKEKYTKVFEELRKDENRKSKAEGKKKASKNAKDRVKSVVLASPRSIMAGSFVANTIGTALTFGSNGNKFLKRCEGLSKNFTFEHTKDKALYKFETIEKSMIIELPSEITTNTCGLLKMFDFLVSQVNLQAWKYGKLTQNYIDINYHDIVDVGIYKDINGARDGFRKSINRLREVRISYKDKFSDTEGQRYLFTRDEDRTTGVTRVYLGTNLNWNIILQYLTYVPPFMYALKTNEYLLARYVFYMAAQKQNHPKIAKGEPFNVGMDNLRERMNLPSPDETKEHYKLIKSPILEAIKFINGLEQTDLELKLINDSKGSVRDWLNKAKLQINITGELKQAFTEKSTAHSNVKQKAIARNALKEKEPAALPEPITPPEEAPEPIYELDDILQSIN